MIYLEVAVCLLFAGILLLVYLGVRFIRSEDEKFRVEMDNEEEVIEFDFGKHRMRMTNAQKETWDMLSRHDKRVLLRSTDAYKIRNY